MSDEFKYTKQETANILSIYEIGTFIGGILLGFLSDLMYAKRSPIGVIAIIISSILAFCFTFCYKSMGTTTLSIIFFTLGLLLGGLMHVISVTCSADLG